jgi:predicted anti-sigma-YlaC factor YlaD
MISECGRFEQLIPRSCAGDLTPEEQQALEQHLTACPMCRREQERYAATLNLLQSADDEPVPRHFFVYPEERLDNLWQLFRRLTLQWQVATAGVASLVLLLGVISFAGLQIRAGQGSWTISFGRGSAGAEIDVAAMKTDILQAADERSRAFTLTRIRDLRSEIADVQSGLTNEQQSRLVAALTTLESRLSNRISATADDFRTATQKASADLYQTISLQRSQDLTAINARFNSAAENDDQKARQTDAILDTLLQVAELSIKQPGGQK